MKKIRNMRKRTGFTLVELLIVIIIIGILAGSMMLVAGSGTDRAEATKIISDLRSMKGAALMYYADENKWPATGDAKTTLEPYMDRVITAGEMRIANAGTGAPAGLYIGKTGLGGAVNLGIRKALKNSATDAGLIGGDATNPTSADIESAASSVWMVLTK